jgi:hypothetical protein
MTQGRLAKIGARNQASQSLISGGLGFARGVMESQAISDKSKDPRKNWYSPANGNDGYFPSRPG